MRSMVVGAEPSAAPELAPSTPSPCRGSAVPLPRYAGEDE